MENSFWGKHYQDFAVREPSKFAKFCIKKYVGSNDTVIELGCGNGRDGVALSQLVKKYVGFDTCPIAVKTFKETLSSFPEAYLNKVQVIQGDFTENVFDEHAKNANRLVIYSRFSLHSIGYEDAEKLFANLAKIKDVPWVLLLEARTIYDTLYGEGENVGLHEFKTDHYRRFIDPNAFLKNMPASFAVSYYEVASGFAPFGEQDPLVMRAVILPST